MLTRVLKFPDQSLGELLDERFPGRPKVAEARGEVTILGRPKLVLHLAEIPRQPAFLKTLPIDALYGIRFALRPLCEAAVPYLSALSGLRMIDLSDSGIDDDVFLRFVTSLPRLRVIDFGGTLVSDFALRDTPRLLCARMFRSLGRRVPIGDMGAVSIGAKMPRLIALDLSHTDLGDAGLRGITHLPLRFLNISGSKATDAGLASLGTTSSLRKLVLSHTKISDTGLYFLQSLSRLTLLMLNGTTVSDEGLPHLLRLPKLRVLYLGSTRITEKAVRSLAQMTRLRILSLGQQLSQDSIESLRKALPNCRISAINRQPGLGRS
jgi:hypothetical protein